ncbi:hypothetical protein T439DRAFT_380644 [Meredithblackwellia eburnea MCA 4105]
MVDTQASPPPEKPKKLKATGPRSRTGCGTCKVRKKKCDEQWVDGKCMRCIEAGITCTMENLRPSRKGLIVKGKAIETTPAPSSASSSSSRRKRARDPVPPSYQASVTSEHSPASHISHESPMESEATVQPHPPLLANLLLPTSTSLPIDPLLFNPASITSAPQPPLAPSTSSTIDVSNWEAAAGGPSTSAVTLDGTLASAPNSSSTNVVDPALPLPGGELDWEELLAHFDDPNSTMREIRDFSAQWWEFCTSLNESYFFSIPKHVRELVKAEMKTLVAGNDLGRAALACWCTAHYAAVLLKEGDPQHAQWDEKANKYYSEALGMLHDRQYPLDVRIGAVLDMRLAQIHRYGAAPANFLLLIGEFFIKEELGERPSVDLPNLTGVHNMCIREFVYADVFRTMCVRNRRTVFDLSKALPLVDLPSWDEFTTSEALRVRLGLPVELLLCFAAVSNLAVDKPNMDPAEFLEAASGIESSIKRWRSDPRTAGDMEDSSGYISDLANFEMWRQTALIYLHQTLHQAGCLSKVLKAALAQFLQLSHSLLPPTPNAPSVFSNASRACCWFLASTVATSEADRNACRDGMLACGIGKVYQDNLSIIEKVWAETDEKGYAPDWREVLERDGLAVAFM